MAFCKELGLSVWLRRSGPWWQLGVGACGERQTEFDILRFMIIRAVLLLLLLAICLPCESRTLDEANAQKFKQAFNQANKSVRLVALLSPT